MASKTLVGTITRVTNDLPSGEDGYYLEQDGLPQTFHRITFASVGQARAIIPHLNKKVALCVATPPVGGFYTTCSKSKFFTLVK